MDKARRGRVRSDFAPAKADAKAAIREALGEPERSGSEGSSRSSGKDEFYESVEDYDPVLRAHCRI